MADVAQVLSNDRRRPAGDAEAKIKNKKPTLDPEIFSGMRRRRFHRRAASAKVKICVLLQSA